MRTIGFVACNRNATRFRGDPSYIHRCENLALALEAAGEGTDLVHLRSLGLSSRYAAALFHRPRQWLRLGLLRPLLGRRGTQLAADVDDLIFDEALAEFSPGVLNGLVPLDKTRRQFAANRRALSGFERITVSTQPLAEHVRRCFPQARVLVLPNTVHRRWRAETPGEAMPDAPVITYLPGTRSHDRDFSLYADGVAAFLADHPDARLEVTGPLHFQLAARPGQVVHREKVPFNRFHERVRAGWINLGPLEQTPFTRCKSALKVLEAGFWGVPTICSRTPDAERFDGAGALFADDAEACYRWLVAMLESERYREVMEGLRERVLAVADVDREARRFLEFVTGG